MQDAASYSGVVATSDEIRAQHSYFGARILNIGGDQNAASGGD